MEIYLAVIKVLDHGDSITKQQIMRKTGINLVRSNEFLTFLVKHELISEIEVGSKVMYAITEKGQRLCNYFGLDNDRSIFHRSGIFRID